MLAWSQVVLANASWRYDGIRGVWGIWQGREAVFRASIQISGLFYLFLGDLQPYLLSAQFAPECVRFSLLTVSVDRQRKWDTYDPEISGDLSR